VFTTTGGYIFSYLSVHSVDDHLIFDFRHCACGRFAETGKKHLGLKKLIKILQFAVANIFLSSLKLQLLLTGKDVHSEKILFSFSDLQEKLGFA
jgi:hypothetical protein